ncbi:MAG: hypothetical protein IJ416_09770 [Ruminiclostridium sp.]|nr:hypothetical protein [Ruminiclostridium sp.]
MAKKKREHIVFDRDMKTKKSIPFSSVNKQNPIKQKKAHIELTERKGEANNE